MTKFDGEDGIVSIYWVVASIVGMVTVAVLSTSLAAVTRTAQQLQIAADGAALAALSGSSLTGGAGEPNSVAAAGVAEANGVELVGLETNEWPLGVVVVTRDTLELPGGHEVTVTASAGAHLVLPPDTGQ